MLHDCTESKSNHNGATFALDAEKVARQRAARDKPVLRISGQVSVRR